MNIPMRLICLLTVCFGLAWPFSARAAQPSLKTKNVFLIISDGFRWQEVFTGAEELLLNKTNGGVANVKAARAEFWRDTPEARRETLLPFFWTHIAKHGQIFGNQAKGSVARITNDKKFSYPGYNETFTGFVDPRIDSNDKKPNPNVTVFEWLHARPGFKNRVAAFASWDVFPYIFNRERSQLPLWPPFEPRFEDKRIRPPAHVTDLMRDTTSLWDIMIFDSYIHHTALDHVKRQKPRVAFLGYGETDEWAHETRYDLYLQSAHNVDRFIRELWQALQSMPQYRDKTTLLITADHGRGSGPKGWRDHGEKVEGAEYIWLAALGPDTPALGERTHCAPITQSQIAATMSELLGEDYRAAYPKAGAPIAEVIGDSASRSLRRKAN